MHKACFAALAGVALSSASPVNPENMPTSYWLHLNLIEKLECARGTGTGWRVDNDLIATAAHVAAAGPCNIGGQPLELVHSDGRLDFAVFRAPAPSSNRLNISCSPPQRARPLYAAGFAFGTDFVVQRLVATDGRAGRNYGPFAGLLIARGYVHSGMSGGPVFDEAGQVVAITVANRRDGRAIAMVRSLSDTYLCEGDNAAS